MSVWPIGPPAAGETVKVFCIMKIRGLQKDVVYLCWPIAPSYTSPNAGGGSCGVSANEYSCAHHVTWSPNKLWKSTSIFNLWWTWKVNQGPEKLFQRRGEQTMETSHLQPSYSPVLIRSVLFARYTLKNIIQTILRKKSCQLIESAVFYFSVLPHPVPKYTSLHLVGKGRAGGYWRSVLRHLVSGLSI